ncbi:hypothetical protein CJD44_15070 [Streptomyces sp. alain-838]|nr:TetR/AcrR family transcriptional regulator [Streptomyces sp. alain-838]PAK25692.1 hypothetical protein CJD44_15070 [Streptomyces sp. alain-838]
MTANESGTEPPAHDLEAAGSWREIAVARSVQPARMRAEQQIQRFLDAALELVNGEAGKDFTVQEVVKRSGQSLRSFYQYFNGKHELLLALFEESVRTTADRLRERVAGEPDGLSRLRRFTLEYHRLSRPLPGDTSEHRSTILGMAEFAQRLLTEHPREAARAFSPLYSLMKEMLDEAAAEGALRTGLDHRTVAGSMLQAIAFNAFAVTISGARVRSDDHDAEVLWELFAHGLARRLPAGDEGVGSDA